jgi:hypothetical protein
MADYYPVIAKHILGLDPGAPGESRRAIYERARGALIEQLRSVHPPLSTSEITNERLALEEAVRKVEGEAAQRARDARAHAPLSASNIKIHGDLSNLQMNFTGLSSRQIHEIEIGPRPVAPPVTIIPEQNLQAIGFNPTRRGPLDLVSDPPRDPFDPEQTILYQRIRSQLKQLKETIPSQERTQIDAAVDDFLDQPENWREVEFKKVLWLCGNSIRTLLTQHDAVKDDPEPHYSKLPPAVAEALRRPVQGWNVFLQTDPDLAQLDAQRLGPREQVEILKHLAAAEKFIDLAVANKNITTDRAAKALTQYSKPRITMTTISIRG